MKMSYIALSLASVFILQQQIIGWGKVDNENMNTQEEMNLAQKIDNRRGFFEIDYLFWKPNVENLNYGFKGFANTDVSPRLLDIKIQKPNFDLGSGVRVGLGGYTSDTWDVGVKGTYFYADASSHAHANFDDSSIGPTFILPISGIGADEASARWQLNLGVLDFFIGRDCCISKKFIIHPFIGARGAWINQSMRVKYESLFNAPGPNPILPISFQLKNNMTGGGPLLGLDLDYYFSREWSFKGGLSGALLYSSYHVHQRTNGWSISTSGAQNSQLWKIRDKDEFVRANLDVYFGIGWDHWFNQNQNRVYLALLCESSYWFGMNHVYDFEQLIEGSGANPQPAFRADKRHGDLTFFGGTLHFQVDF